MSNQKRYPSQLAERLLVRFPDGLREKIREEAARNCRSMNSEVVYHLQQAFPSHSHENKEGPVSA